MSMTSVIMMLQRTLLVKVSPQQTDDTRRAVGADITYFINMISIRR